MEIKSTLRRIQLIIALGGIVVLSGMIVTGCGGGRLSVSSSQFQVQESPQYELETEVTGIAEQRLDYMSGQEELTPPETQDLFPIFVSRIYSPTRPEYQPSRNPYATYVGQCTWYVFGRIQEPEVGLPSFLSDHNVLRKIFGNGDMRAKDWDDRAKEAAKLAGLPGLELKIGSKPRPRSIAVWERDYSHAAFVENDRGQITESNYVRTDGSFNPGNDAEVIIHGDPGSDRVRIYAKIGDKNPIGFAYRFHVMRAVDVRTEKGQRWYLLKKVEGNSAEGWALHQEVVPNTVWNFTRIRRRPSDLGGGRPQPDCYIYLNVPEIPQLSSPSNGATNVSINPTLRWNSAKRATSYQIEVARDQNFATVVFRTSTTSTSAQVNGLARNTRYWWRVKALNDDGSSPWSGAWYFTTQR